MQRVEWLEVRLYLFPSWAEALAEFCEDQKEKCADNPALKGAIIDILEAILQAERGQKALSSVHSDSY